MARYFEQSVRIVNVLSLSFLLNTYTTFSEQLRLDREWDPKIDGDFFDRQGVSLLGYAVCANNLEVTKCLLNDIEENGDG